jgi:hypothetical protein
VLGKSLEVRVHFGQLRASSAKRAADLLERLAFPWVLDFLKRVPLDRLDMKPKLIGRAMGSYIRMGTRTRVLQLATGRGKETWGETMSPGVWSVSKTGKSQREAITRTFVHEMAHHIHLHDWATGGQAFFGVDALVRSAFVRTKGPLTQYGQSSPAEYFAESFAAYVFHPELLKNTDLNGFDMVEDVLALRGITIR